MVGFLGALAGGAARGWSKGQLESIKAKREEKLKMLDMQFTASQNELTRGVQREQIASSERQAAASLGVQKSIAEMQAANQKSIAELGASTDLTRTRETLAANQKLADQAQDATQRLNTKLTEYTKPDGTKIWRMTTPDGTLIKNPVDEQGNELSIVPTTDDTDDIKNMKSLMQLGVPQERAMNVIFEGKDMSRDQLETRLYEAITEGMSTMKNLNEDDFDFARKQAKETANDLYGPDTPTAEPETPGSPDTSATENIKIPSEWSDEQVKAAIADAINRGADKEKLKRAVLKNGRVPAKVGL